MSDVFVIANTTDLYEKVKKYTEDVNHVPGEELNSETIESILANVKSDYFFVIQEKYDLPIEDLSRFPWNFDTDEDYVHMWDGKVGIMLFKTDSVKAYPDNFTDDAMTEGKFPFKDLGHIKSYEATTYVLAKGTDIPDAIPLHNDRLTLHSLNVIKRTCKTPYFYVIKGDVESNLDFSEKVEDYEMALTFWNDDDSIRLFRSDKVFENIKGFTDDAWWNGEIKDVANIVDTDLEIGLKESKIEYKDYDLVLLTRGWPDWCQRMATEYGEVIHVDSFDFGLKEVHEILDRCHSEYIFVANNYVGNFDFSYKMPEYDEQYMHLWNDSDALRLIKRDTLLERASYFTDQAILNAITDIKSVYDDKLEFGELDIVFMSYGELNADENYAKLKKRFPRAKRLDGIKGIFNAHKAAAHLAGTPMFYVVDGDAEILDSFNFDLYPNIYDRDCVYTWRSHNPCNGLEYGYGGVKLFPTKAVRDIDEWSVDFTTSVSENFKAMPEVSNVTAYNTDAFTAWRSGFREGVKLSSGVIARQVSEETMNRVTAWTQVALPVPFAEESKDGAQLGYLYGQKHFGSPVHLKRVNDYDWLKEQFENGTDLVGY